MMVDTKSDEFLAAVGEWLEGKHRPGSAEERAAFETCLRMARDLLWPPDEGWLIEELKDVEGL